MTDRTYVVAGCRPWTRRVFDEVLTSYPGSWHYTERPEELDRERLQLLDPRYIFFLHWTWRVPEELINRFECVCFHMTDVPYGRGGSPLQNLILAGHRTTKLSALRMVSEFDAGPVYLKRDLSLAGRAQEIYERMVDEAAAMIRTMIETMPEPRPQQGAPTIFRRRTPEESAIPEALASPEAVYDFIRMLDADGYPHAFVDRGGFRHHYRNARLGADGTVRADVVIAPRPEPSR
jgi:methionyl-tRNA formyltransferase